MPKCSNEYEYDVYVNKIHQRRLHYDNPWWSFHAEDNAVRQDWRYLLKLNTPELEPTNELLKYYVHP